MTQEKESSSLTQDFQNVGGVIPEGGRDDQKEEKGGKLHKNLILALRKFWEIHLGITL